MLAWNRHKTLSGLDWSFAYTGKRMEGGLKKFQKLKTVHNESVAPQQKGLGFDSWVDRRLRIIEMNESGCHLCVSPVIDWQPVHGVPRPLCEVRLDWLQLFSWPPLDNHHTVLHLMHTDSFLSNLLIHSSETGYSCCIFNAIPPLHCLFKQLASRITFFAISKCVLDIHFPPSCLATVFTCL